MDNIPTPPSWLKVGVKVVCIRTPKIPSCGEYKGVVYPSKGNIYTIREVYYDFIWEEQSNEYIVTLKEIVNKKYSYISQSNDLTEQCWQWYNFKPLVNLDKTLKEDVFLFEPLLLTKNIDELVR